MRNKIVYIVAAGIIATSIFTGCGQTDTSQSTQSEQSAQSEQSTQSTQSEQSAQSARTYSLSSSVEVEGRQGIALEGDYYYVSGSTELVRYDKDWNIVAENKDPFSEGYTAEVNHIGDIDVYNGEVYCGVEKFLDGEASNIQIAIYDAETLKLKRTFPFDESSGQTECSGIAVNPDNETVWMSSWADGDSGRYLYEYDLNSGKYLRKVHMHAVPQWIQGVAYYDGLYYVTADDGDADYDEPDHVYRLDIEDERTEVTTVEELTLNDVTRQGEIEGLSFDAENKELLVLYNRGARIILGMPTGFYDGYDEEIHEVYTYNFQ